MPFYLAQSFGTELYLVNISDISFLFGQAPQSSGNLSDWKPPEDLILKEKLLLLLAEFWLILQGQSNTHDLNISSSNQYPPQTNQPMAPSSMHHRALEKPTTQNYNFSVKIKRLWVCPPYRMWPFLNWRFYFAFPFIPAASSKQWPCIIFTNTNEEYTHC